MRSMLYTGLAGGTVARISLLVLLSTIDYALTCYAINAGIAKEVNPILSWLSLEGIGLVKTAGLLILIYFYWRKPRILNMAIIVMALVVIWNIGCILY